MATAAISLELLIRLGEAGRWIAPIHNEVFAGQGPMTAGHT